MDDGDGDKRSFSLCSYDKSRSLTQTTYTPYHRIADCYLLDHDLIVEIDGSCHEPEKDRHRDEQFVRRIQIGFVHQPTCALRRLRVPVALRSQCSETISPRQ